MLTKVDKINDWVNGNHTNVKTLLEKQSQDAENNFWSKVNYIIEQLKTLGLNSDLFHINSKKKRLNEYISIIPISSITGDGFADVFTALIGLTHLSV